MSLPSSETIDHDYRQTAHDLAVAYDYPELEVACLNIVDNGHNEKRDDVFPMREVSSRSLKFEFSKSRYAHFNTEFVAWLGDKPVAETQDLENTSRFLFIGAAAARSIIEFDQVRVIRSRGPRHLQVLNRFYSSNKDIMNAFSEMFSGDESEFKVVADDIKERDVPTINGYRAMLSYLYGGYATDINKKVMFSELLRDSRAAIVEVIKNQNPAFCNIGRAGYGRSEGQMVGNYLTADVLPSWLLALAVPMTKESYNHLGSELWNDAFAIEPATLVADKEAMNEIGFVDEDQVAQQS